MHVIQALPTSILFILISLPYSYQVILSPEVISISALLTDDRPCVRTCVDGIAFDVNCNDNSCLCRSDVMTSAIPQLELCLTGAWECGGPDVLLAESRYSSYCSVYDTAVGIVPASVPATTTSGGATGTATGMGSSNSFPSKTSSSSSSTSSDSALESGSCTVGALSCGAVGGISIASLVAVVGAIASVIRIFRRNKTNKQSINVNGDLNMNTNQSGVFSNGNHSGVWNNGYGHSIGGGKSYVPTGAMGLNNGIGYWNSRGA